MQIKNIKKYNSETPKEKLNINQRIINTNIALKKISEHLSKGATLIYSAAVITSSIGVFLSLITKSEQENLNLSSETSLLEGMINNLEDTKHSR